MKEAIELAQPTYQKHIYVYLNPDNPAWRAGKEIILSYETLCTEILSGAAEIHTFQTWPLTFERDLGLKYGYAVHQVDHDFTKMFEEVIECPNR